MIVVGSCYFLLTLLIPYDPNIFFFPLSRYKYISFKIVVLYVVVVVIVVVDVVVVVVVVVVTECLFFEFLLTFL